MTALATLTEVNHHPKAADEMFSPVAAEGPSNPDFRVGVRARAMLAFAGLMLPAAAALYIYGQISPGV